MATRIILTLKNRGLCRHAFWELNIMTLPCLYVLGAALLGRFEAELVPDRDFMGIILVAGTHSA